MTTSREKEVLAKIGRIDLDKIEARERWVGDAIELLQIDYNAGNLSEWECNFLESVMDIYYSRRTLSEKQFETLNRIVRAAHPGEEWDG